MKSTRIEPLNGPKMRMPQSAWWSAFSHDGRQLYTCGYDPHIWVWDVRTFKLATRLKTELSSFYGPDIHPSLPQVAAGGTDGTVRVWDASTGREILAAAPHHRGATSAVRFADAGRTLLSAGVDGTIRQTDATHGMRQGRLKRLGSHIHGLTVARTGPHVGAVHRTGVRVWDKELVDVFRFDGLYYHGGEGQSDLALPGDGKMLWVTFRKEPYLRIWDLNRPTVEPTQCVELDEPAFKLAFSRDETLAAVALYEEIVLVQSRTCEVVARWPVPNGSERHKGAVCGISFSPDGRLLASTDVDGGIWVWSVEGV